MRDNMHAAARLEKCLRTGTRVPIYSRVCVAFPRGCTCVRCLLLLGRALARGSRFGVTWDGTGAQRCTGRSRGIASSLPRWAAAWSRKRWKLQGRRPPLTAMSF